MSETRAGKAPPRRIDVPLPPERDVDRELAFHIDETFRGLVAEGWSAEQARQEAARRFGDRAAIRGACVRIVREHRQARRRAQMLDDLIQDLRYAVRMLRRQPRIAALAVLTMGLGVGAVSALFTLVYQVVLAPLPYSRSEAIVDLAEGDENGHAMPVSSLNFADWHAQAASFEAMAAHATGASTLVRGLDEPLRAQIAAASGDFFAVFGARPLVGRLFADTAPLADGAAAAVVSEGFWQQWLGAAGPDRLADRQLEIWGLPVTVIGVVPEAFRFPERTELWLAFDPIDDGSGRTAHNWRVVGRLQPGADRSTADAELDTIAARLAAEHAGDNDARSVVVRPLREALVGPVRRPLMLLMGASVLLLLLACANLTSDLLARATARRDELAIRAALGAGRKRIARQLLSETVMLHLFGALAGIGAAALAVRGLVALRPAELVRLDEVGIDLGVLLFGVAVALVTGLLFGLAPALAGGSLAGAIGGGGRGTYGRRKGRTFDLLVAGEATLALVLLASAVVLLRSFLALTAVDFGFRPEGALTADLLPPPPPAIVWDDPSAVAGAAEGRAGLLAKTLQHVAAVPGAVAAGLISDLPLSGSGPNGLMCVDHLERTVYAEYRLVAGDYFDAMAIPLLAGRALGAQDRWGSQPTAVISRRFADQAWPGEDPIGKQLCSAGMDNFGEVMATVVGVVGDVRHDGPTEPPRATAYFSLAQRALRSSAPTLVVRAAGEAPSLGGPVRAAIAGAVSDMPVAVSTLEERLATYLAPRRFALLLVAVFALVALALAATGIYGVVAYGVSRRRREVGIRMALGAAPGSVVRALMARTLAVVGVGLALGTALAAMFGHSLSSLVAGLRSVDAATLGVAVALLATVAAAACWLPARRATRIDPTATLRAE